MGLELEISTGDPIDHRLKITIILEIGWLNQ